MDLKLITKLCSALLLIVVLTGCSEATNVSYDCDHQDLIRKEWQTKKTDLNIYVSAGSTDGDGSLEQPFGTLEQARDYIRDIKPSAETYTGVNVLIREGVYQLTDSFKLEANDSGSANMPIVYTAYKEEEVILSGGIKLDANKFSKIDTTNLDDRINLNIADNLVVYDLTGYEIGDIKKNGFRWDKQSNPTELFVNQKSQPLAKYPNEGFLKVDDVVNTGFIPASADKKISKSDYIKQEGPTFKVDVDQSQLKKWKLEDQLWTYGYWEWDWADDNLQIESIDENNMTVTAAHPSFYGMKKDSRFYVYNALSELDQPGEWYIDNEAKQLYYYPQDNFLDASIELSLLDKPLLDINASNVTFNNLILELTRDDGIQMMNASNNIVSNTIFRNIGSKAIEIGDVDNAFDGTVMLDAESGGGANNTVTNNQIYNTGAGGVYVIGGDRENLVSANHVIENNYFCNYARINKTYSPAISLNGVGSQALNNEIHNAPHMGIQFAGNNMLIKNNEIYDVAKETSDVGVIYSVRDWTYRGNVIDGNFIHHIYSMDEGEGSFGIYLDDMMSSAEVKNNIFYEIENAAFLIGGGRDHYIHDNIIINTKIGIIADNRATNWAEATATAPDGTMHVALNNSPYQNEIWRAAYPELTNILNEEYKKPQHNRIKNNVFINTKKNKIDKDVKADGTVENNEFIKAKLEDIFENPGEMNFTIKDDSKIKNKIPEFYYSDFSEIGIQSQFM